MSNESPVPQPGLQLDALLQRVERLELLLEKQSRLCLALCKDQLELRRRLLGEESGQRALPDEFLVTPEILAWARQQFTEEEIVAGLRDIRETGGLELGDFIHELEEAVGRDD